MFSQVTGDGKFFLSCGHWDGTFKFSHVESGRILQTVGQHKDIVTSLCLGQDGTTLVTGSLDATGAMTLLQPTHFELSSLLVASVRCSDTTHKGMHVNSGDLGHLALICVVGAYSSRLCGCKEPAATAIDHV